MHILITGAAGMVGRKLTERLIADGGLNRKTIDKFTLVDVMKKREGYFRAYDNQMMMEMYAVRAKKAADMKDQWDIYDALGTVPAAGEDLEVIAPPKGACNIG